MHAVELLRNIGEHTLRPVYALVGDEAFLKRSAVAAVARKAAGAEQSEAEPEFTTHFQGDSIGLADLFDELRTAPLFASRSVVVLENADPFVTAHRKELESYIDHPASGGVLILLVRTWPSTTRLAKLVEKLGGTVECKALAERELPAWLAHHAKSHGNARLETEAARVLVELVGPDLALLVSELDKLATFVGDRGNITRADVTTMVGTGRIETIWKMLEAATTGQMARALDDLDRLIGAGEHPVGLLAAMSASLRKVYHAALLRLQKHDAADACREAGIPPFATQQTLKQHTHLGPARVARLPAMLLRADLDLKGGSMLSPRTVLERLVVQLATPRQD